MNESLIKTLEEAAKELRGRKDVQASELNAAIKLDTAVTLLNEATKARGQKSEGSGQKAAK
jgi:hypothetical protein